MVFNFQMSILFLSYFLSLHTFNTLPSLDNFNKAYENYNSEVQKATENNSNKED